MKSYGAALGESKHLTDFTSSVVFVCFLGKQHICLIEQSFVCFQNLRLNALHANLVVFSSVTGKGGYYLCFKRWHREENLVFIACFKSVMLQEFSVLSLGGSESVLNSS